MMDLSLLFPNFYDAFLPFENIYFSQTSMTLFFPLKTLIKSASLNNLVDVTYAPNMF